MVAEIKPCPFCNKIKISFSGFGGCLLLKCICGVSLWADSKSDSEQDLINKWNRRVNTAEGGVGSETKFNIQKQFLKELK